MSIADAIKRARELDQAATPGAWIDGQRVGRGSDVIATEGKHGYLVAENCGVNAHFIATTRNAWKAAVDVIEAANRLSDNIAEFDTITDGCFLERLDDALAAFAEAMGEKT